MPALELPEFAVLLFELLGPFPVLADELVSVGEIMPPELALLELPLSLAVPAESPEVDCAFPTGLPLFELLAPLPVVADGLLPAGVVVVEPPLLEPLFDGELFAFPLPSLLVLSLPLAELLELDCALPTALSLPLLPDDELFAFELLVLPAFPLLDAGEAELPLPDVD